MLRLQILGKYFLSLIAAIIFAFYIEKTFTFNFSINY